MSSEDKEEKQDSLVYTYTQDTTLHGVGRAASKDRSCLKRVVWLIICLSCVSLFTYFLSSSLVKYFDYPINTKLTYTTQAKLDFPSVTICNYNQVNASYLAIKNDAQLNATAKYLNDAIFSVTGEVPTVTPELLDYMETLGSEKFYKEGAHNVEMTYVSCQYPGVQDQFLSCDLPDGLMKTTSTQMGICQTFHPQSYIAEHGAIKSGRTGSTGGLSVLLNVYQDLYRTSFSMSAGVKVLVHHPKTLPRVFELGLALHPGTEANIKVKQNEMTTLGYPFSKSEEDACLDTLAEDFVNPLEYHEYYSYAACLEEKVTQRMVELCGCHYAFYVAPGIPYCDMKQVVVCIYPFLDRYYKNGTGGSGCKKPCHEITYEVTVSQSKFPNQQRVEELIPITGFDADFFRENTIFMNVFFGELGYTKIEQTQEYTIPSAFAEIGGYMGLCLGASILTVFELAELFWDYCARWKNNSGKMKQKNKISEVEPVSKTF